MTTKDCALNTTQIILTNLNFSLICNTKAHRAQLIVYEAVLFTEVILSGHLFLQFINDLEGRETDYSILLTSMVISNQILIMDLIFRAAYEDREREEDEEERMLGRMKIKQTFDSNQTLNAANNPLSQNDPIGTMLHLNEVPND